MVRVWPLALKPGGGAQGTGVQLVWSRAELEQVRTKLHARDGYVVQRYIARPLLLGGYKFDLRLYVLVLSLRPLRVFLCREGLVRVCSEPYEEPLAAGERGERHRRNRATRHLTNYSLNKFSSQFSHHDDPSDGRCLIS